MRRTRSSSTAPSIVQPKAVASPHATRGRLASGAAWHSATTRRKSSTNSSVPRRTLARLWPSLTDSTKFISCTPSANPRSAPLRFGISADTVSSGNDRAWRTTASASASCGSNLGGTNELTSISRTPAACSASSQAIFRSVGMISAMLCKPVAQPDFADKGTFAHSLPPDHARGKASPGAPFRATVSDDVLRGQRADFVAVAELDLDRRMGDAETGVELCVVALSAASPGWPPGMTR